MRLSGRFRWYQFEFALMALFAGVVFAFGISCVVFGGILGALYAINVDHTLWPTVPAGWGMGAIALFCSAWLTRRLLRTVRWFELDEDVLRYECMGSRRRFTYHVRDVIKIIDYDMQGSIRYWKIVFADKNWTCLRDAVENARDLVHSLMGNSPKPSLAHRLLNGVIFERYPEAATPASAVPDENPPSLP